MKLKLSFFILSLFFTTVFYSQKLDKAKNNLKKKTTYKVSHQETNTNTRRQGGESFSNILAYELLVKPLIFVVKSLSYGIFIESIFEDQQHKQMELTPYPYLENLKGDYAFKAESFAPTRVDISNQFLTDMAHTYGNNLNVKFRFLERASLEYNQLYLLENQKNTTSQLFIQDITANYYRIRLPNLTLHYGAGVSYVHSNINRAYFTYNTGIQYFTKYPLSISLEHKGTPLSTYGVSQTKINFNYHKNKYAIQAGVNFYSIGNVSYIMPAVGGKVYL